MVVNDEQTHIAVRYEQHNHAPGGSIWVQIQNRRDYNDEWLCVWSTDPGRPGLALSMMDPRFETATTPAADITIPVSWLPTPAVIEGAVLAPPEELTANGHVGTLDAQPAEVIP